jgi:PPP family 3-phenylpropionic acid transporter
MIAPVLVGLAVAGAAISLTAPRIGRARPPAGQTGERAMGGFPPLFLAVAIAGGLIQASHGLLYGFGSIHWTQQGLSAAQVGVLWAVGVGAEIAMFQFAGTALRRMSAIGLILAGGAAAVLRWSIMPIDLPFSGYLAVQLLHGLTFGAMHAGMMQFYASAIPEERMGKAQGVSFMIGGGLLAASSLASGPLFDAFGATAFLAMAGIAAAGFVVLWVARRRQPQSSGEGGEANPAS